MDLPVQHQLPAPLPLVPQLTAFCSQVLQQPRVHLPATAQQLVPTANTPLLQGQVPAAMVPVA
jgi:hypothetical protein